MTRAAGRPAITAVVLTLDEERDLARCLASVAWCDERVVLDSGSVDRTPEIALRHGARFESAPWSGFAAARNRAVELASHDWVLALDADEWLAEGACEAIERAIASADAQAYALPRRNLWCGGVVRHAFGADRVVRLVRRGTGRFRGARLHDGWRADLGSRVADLDAPIVHLSYRTVEDYGARIARYARLAAHDRADRGARFSAARLAFGPLGAFLRSWVLRRGALDGVRGLTVSFGAAWYVALREAALWERTCRDDAEVESLVPPTSEDPDPASAITRDRSGTGGAGR